ncbi:MAG: type II toxin-antitoxin system RelE/ParE family toxin [Pseudobdellovibrionaceae bacterium]|nr:MAG: type II toxin-antitoxin system RelE/ParE family toxin [Pseudobdellovibrionaceae bacterium]
MIEKQVIYYTLENGNSPFRDWLKKLDNLSRAIVVRFIQRVASGGARKSIKALKDGIFEIKITHGPGYRVYFAEDGNDIIILLIGGDKKTQTRDIDKAKEFWRTYGKQT